MKDFEYAAASSIDEAVSLLAAGGDRAKALAGGTDLIVQLREGLRVADMVVDIKKIPELTEMTYSAEQGLCLGAAVPCYRIYEHAEVATDYAALADAAKIIGGWQIQSRASVGGNLCNASPAADSIPPLIVYRAVCKIAGPQGTRSVPAAEFCTAPGKSVLGRGEFLVSIELPPQGQRSGAHYLRFIPRNEMDIAVVGAAAWISLDENNKIQDACVALSAVAPRPLLVEQAAKALIGQTADETAFEAAAKAAQGLVTPISDMRGPAEYRTHLTGVLTKRALRTALERANTRGA